jgi:hypothetical protein
MSSADLKFGICITLKNVGRINQTTTTSSHDGLNLLSLLAKEGG